MGLPAVQNDNADKLDWRKRAVILYDPTPFTRRLLSDVLRHAGGELVRASGDADVAVRMCLNARDPILIAGWAPDNEGALSLVRSMRRHHTVRRKSPAVILSTRANQLDVEAARDAGADSFLLRPVSPAAIVERLDHAARTWRDFIEAPGYTGPDRRRQLTLDPDFTPVLKRQADIDAGQVEPFRALLNQADQIAIDMMRSNDPIGARVGRSLRRYLEQEGERGARESEIVDLHRSAVSRLKELRAARPSVRMEIVTGLERIVRARVGA